MVNIPIFRVEIIIMVQSKKTKEQLLAEIDASKKKLVDAKNRYHHNGRIEKKLKESEEKYRNLFHLSNDGIFIHDLNAKIIEVNKKALELLGYNKSEILRLTIIDLHPKESIKKSKEAFNKIKRDGFVQFEIDFKKKNGQIFLAEVSSSIIEMQGKKVVQGIVRDITERKRSEIELKKSQKKLDSIVRAVPDVIYRVDKEARITFISEIIRDYGYSPKELIGKSIFTLVHPEDLEKAKWHVNERRTGRRRTKSFELRMFPKGRHYVPFDIHAKDILKDYIFLLEAEGLYSTDKPETKSFLGSQGIARDITERKLAETALKESEEKFRSIVENSHVGIGIIDDNFKFTYVNDIFVKITGYSKKELLGQGFQALLDKNNRDFLIERYIRRQKGDDVPNKYEINVKRKNGQEIVLELISVVIEDSKGKKRTIVQLLDITERRKAEKALAESENKFRQVFHNANDAIYLWMVTEDGKLGKCIEVNNKACCMLGYRRDEILQMTPWDVNTTESAKEIPKVFEILQKKKHHTFEITHLTKNGQKIPVEVSSHIFNLDGKKVILSISRNITERKKTENALVDSEKRFRTVFNSAALGMVIVNPKGHFLQTNKSFQEMFGYSEKELKKFNFSQLSYSGDRRDGQKLFQKLNKGESDHVWMEKRYVRKDGDIIWGNVIASAVRDDNGKQLYNIAMIENISERKRAEKALDESQEKLRNVINHTTVILWAIDKNGIFTFSQGKGLATLGLRPGEVVGKSLFQFYKHNKRLTSDARRALRGETFNSVYIEKDIIFETRFSPLYDSKGKIVGATGISTDITERKRSEEVLHRKTYQQEQLLETAKHLTASLNLTEVLTRIAEEATKMLKAHGCVIYLLEPDNETLTPVVAIDPEYEKEILSSSINVNNSFTGQAIKAGCGIIFNDADEDSSGYQIPGTPEAEEEHIIVAPFLVEDKVLGAMCLDRTDVRFSKEDLAITETLATYASTALKNAKAHHTLKIEVEERKQMQQALIESEEKFRNLAEQSPNMIFINCKGKVVYANEKCEEIMGYTREKMYSPDFNFMKLIAPESSELIKTNFKKHTQDQELQPYEYTLINRSGERIEALITTKLINYGGKRAILGIITDIGEQKRTEEALKISEEKYRRLFEEDLTGDFIATQDGTLLACNSAYLRIFGFNSEEEAYNCKLIDLYPTPQHYNDFLELLKGEEILEYHEIELRRFDKKPVHVIANMIGKFDQNGELTEIIGYFFDDTERKVLEQQFRQAQKMEAIGRLAGGVAHDFNNLLTIINGYSDLMLHRLAKNHPMNREIRQIKQAGDKATRLTNQLLAFSRRQVMQPRFLNLNTVVTDIDKILKRIIGEDIELIISLDPDLGTIKADPVQIEQVLMNLAVNARDAMPHGGMLSIETDMVDLKSDYNHKRLVIQPAGPYVRLSIIDTGIGMDEDTQSQIFEPFFTTKELGKGTGLGLSTVYGIVKQSNGYIWVDSKPEEGTTFQIYFPRVMDKAQQFEIEQKTKKTYGGNETILLVEDEVMVRELAAEILKENGYKILESSRGEQALEISSQYKGKIELMISDVVMPGISGRELANLLINERPDMKVLFISGYSDEVVANQGNTEENFEFLQKPFVPDKFLECIRNILDQK